MDGLRREMNGSAQWMDGGGGGGNGRWWASRWETATAVARSRWATATAAVAQWKARRRRDHDVQHRDPGGLRRWATMMETNDNPLKNMRLALTSTVVVVVANSG